MTAPQLLRAFATDSVHITLFFDEPLDSVKAAVAANYTISDGIGSPQIAMPIAPVFEKVSVRLNSPLNRGTVYIITVSAVTDCAGNQVDTKNMVRVGLSSVADSLDMVIN
ncbi:MAG: Ig-like domain-containing protein [Chitinophagaceae bacterium]|nr:Ig-like domain-containing protein [Chitinophagaceae bacterium]